MSYYSDRHYKADDKFDRLYFEMFFRKGAQILDIGCTTGNFAAQDPKNILGIDNDDRSLKAAEKRNLNVKKCDAAKKLPFGNGTFDMVNCRHVIEHLNEPLFLMEEIFRILKKSGKLVLMTDEATPRFWDDYTHKKPFTKKSLEQIAYDAGFRKFEIYYFPQGIFGLGFLYSNGIVSSKSAKKLNKFFGRLKRDCIVMEAWR